VSPDGNAAACGKEKDCAALLLLKLLIAVLSPIRDTPTSRQLPAVPNHDSAKGGMLAAWPFFARGCPLNDSRYPNSRLMK